MTKRVVPQPPFTKEKEFLRWVVNEAEERGWKVAHIGASVNIVQRAESDPRGPGKIVIPDKGTAGFPDLVMVRERLLCAELKLTPNKPTGNQINWLEALNEAGIETHVWTDRQLELIQRTLDTRIDPTRMARLFLASDGDIDHSVAVAQLIANKEGRS